MHHGNPPAAAVPHDQPPGQDAQHRGRGHLGGPPQRRGGLRPGGDRRRRQQHGRVPRIAEHRFGPPRARAVSGREQPVRFLHPDANAVPLPANLRPGPGLWDLRPDDRRHGRLGRVPRGLPRAGRDAGRAAADDPGVHEPPAARPCGLRQGGLRQPRADGGEPAPRSAAGGAAGLGAGLCPDRAADRPDRGTGRGRGPRRGDAGAGGRAARAAPGFPGLRPLGRTAR